MHVFFYRKVRRTIRQQCRSKNLRSKLMVWFNHHWILLNLAFMGGSYTITPHIARSYISMCAGFSIWVVAGAMCYERDIWALATSFCKNISKEKKKATVVIGKISFQRNTETIHRVSEYSQRITWFQTICSEVSIIVLMIQNVKILYNGIFS